MPFSAEAFNGLLPWLSESPGALNKYSDLVQGQTILPSHLGAISEFGGFDTRNCCPCSQDISKGLYPSAAYGLSFFDDWTKNHAKDVGGFIPGTPGADGVIRQFSKYMHDKYENYSQPNGTN